MTYTMNQKTLTIRYKTCKPRQYGDLHAFNTELMWILISLYGDDMAKRMASGHIRREWGE